MQAGQASTPICFVFQEMEAWDCNEPVTQSCYLGL